MTFLLMVADPVWGVKKSIEATADSMLGVRDSEETTVVSPELDREDPKEAIVKVLERAADDPAFIAELTYQGSKALQGYNLTLEEQAALLSGDVNWIEAHVGNLDERLSTWPQCRLQQEIW